MSNVFETPPSQKSFSILVIRCDRLGDVLLSTPVLKAIKQGFKGAKVTLMVQASVAPILKGLPEVDELLIYEPTGRHAGVSGFFRLISDLRARRFRMGILLQSQFKLAAAVFGAGIRYRVGPLSKLYSFFFYNRGLRQRRSRVEMHEADYNLQLLRRIGIRVPTREILTSAYVSEEKVIWAKKWLSNRGIDPKATVVAIHPGMGGSALNWPEEHYVHLAKALLLEQKSVLLTGGLLEKDLIRRVCEKIESETIGKKDLAGKLTHFIAGPEDTLENLGALYQNVQLVVAPSTGPMHLAVALGRPVVTFFPPIRVQSAIRWGPYLQDDFKASVLIPDNYCGQDFKCRGPSCHYYPCMKRLSVNEALHEVNQQLEYAKNKI